MPRAKFPKTYVGAIEVQWLREQIEVNKIPQTSLANAMEMDPSAISRILSGGRRFKESEYNRAAAFVETYALGAAARLRRAMLKSRLTIEELADRTGLGIERIDQITASKGQSLDTDEAAALSKVLGPLPEYFLFDDYADLPPGLSPELFRYPAQPTEAAAASPAPRLPNLRDASKLDVYAAAIPVGRGIFRRVERLAERRLRPPALIDVDAAFAMFIEGDELAPRYCDGEAIFVHPNRSAGIGKWAMVQLEMNLFVIGRVTERRSGLLVLEVPNQPERVEIETSRIRSQGLIAGSWNE